MEKIIDRNQFQAEKYIFLGSLHASGIRSTVSTARALFIGLKNAKMIGHYFYLLNTASLVLLNHKIHFCVISQVCCIIQSLLPNFIFPYTVSNVLSDINKYNNCTNKSNFNFKHYFHEIPK